MMIMTEPFRWSRKCLRFRPNNPDTDGDGIEDGVEVWCDIANPLDEEYDGIMML